MQHFPKSDQIMLKMKLNNSFYSMDYLLKTSTWINKYISGNLRKEIKFKKIKIYI